MDCYGSKLFNHRSECPACQLFSECGSARDISPLYMCELNENILNEPTPSPDPSLFDADQLDCIIRAAVRHPKSWQLWRSAMKNPSASLTELAKEIGLHSRQAGHYHAMKFAREACLPESIIRSVLQRHRRAEPSPYYSEQPKWIDTTAA